jgi:1,4-alpha-glucan branching enzyme
MTRSKHTAGRYLEPDPRYLARLVNGVHHDPHAILGAHEYGDHTVIRTYRPQADEVVALVGETRYVMQHIDAGLFAVALPFANLIDYRLEVSYNGSDPKTIADPYRFLPTLGEVDLHLFA